MLPVTSVPIRIRRVACAIAARMVHASKMSPARWRPIGTKWSNAQQLSNPASSTSAQICRSSSMDACCCDALIPNVGPGTDPPLTSCMLIVSSTDDQVNDRIDAMSTDPAPRLGYLLKHAHLSYAELAGSALAPHGVDGREVAVLSRLSGPDPLSQQEIARRLGIDRTTMVALVDALE